MSLMKLFMMFIALLLIPVSECTCFNTLKMYSDQVRVAFLFPFLAPLALGALGLGALFPLPPLLPPALAPPAYAGIRNVLGGEKGKADRPARTQLASPLPR